MPTISKIKIPTTLGNVTYDLHLPDNTAVNVNSVNVTDSLFEYSTDVFERYASLSHIEVSAYNLHSQSQGENYYLKTDVTRLDNESWPTLQLNQNGTTKNYYLPLDENGSNTKTFVLQTGRKLTLEYRDLNEYWEAFYVKRTDGTEEYFYPSCGSGTITVENVEHFRIVHGDDVYLTPTLDFYTVNDEPLIGCRLLGSGSYYMGVNTRFSSDTVPDLSYNPDCVTECRFFLIKDTEVQYNGRDY